MNVLIAGIDGYLGWPLALHLKARGHRVAGLDNLSRRYNVGEHVDGIFGETKLDSGGNSVIPIPTIYDRVEILASLGIEFLRHDLAKPDGEERLVDLLTRFKPDAIIHLAEQPSAPFSMTKNNCLWTMQNNIMGSMRLLWLMRECCPQSHLVKLGCFDDETEILTREGWKLFANLTGEEDVATRTEDDRHIVFKKPKSVHVFDHEGPMYRVVNNRLDMSVTPNHRIFTAKRSDCRYGPLRLESAEDIYGKRRVYDIGAEWEGECPETVDICGREVDAVVWVRFLGWYLSEGSTPHPKDRPNPSRISIKQKRGSSSDILSDDLRALAETWNLNLQRYDDSPDNDINNFVIYGKELALYCAQFGKSADKFIPPEVKAWGKPLLTELLSTLVEGDGWGHGRGHRYFSISRRLADDVQEIALKCGWAATVSPGKGGYTVNISMSTYAHVNQTPSEHTDFWEDYNGKVYCVDVGDGHGIILVRRNGCPFWSGNTMGEYGTPNIDITEGRIEVEFRGRKDLLPFPRQPGSWYHLTKVHDTWNVEFACKVWGLRSTDIMQGVVYGTRTDEMGKDEALRTRFDCDEAFGTAINRFCAQAVVGIPLTVYGAGGQTRGYLGIRDSIQCFTIAIEHPPAEGEYRVFNQFDDSYSVNKLAEAVQAAGERLGMDVTIESIENPRVEMEEHHYHPDHTKLAELGFRPVTRLHTELEMMLCDLKQHRDRIEKIRDHIMPKTFWKKS